MTSASRCVRRSWIVAVAALVAAGCSGRAETRAAAIDAAPPADAAPRSRIAELVEQLRDGDDAMRVRVTGRIAALALRGELTAPEGIAVLAAIPAMSPPTQAPALDAIFLRPHPEYVAVVETLAPGLSPEARTSALVGLARTDDPTAAAAIVRLLEANPGEPEPRLFVELALRPRPELFPDLLRLAANPALRDPVLATALAYCDRRKVRAATLAVHGDVVLARWRELRPAVEAAQEVEGVAWRWEPDYRALRDEAGVLLDLLGCLPRKQVDKELRAALALADPRLRLVAARALLFVGVRPPRKALEGIAADVETRAALYEMLQRRGKKRLFPKKWRDQSSLAASLLAERLARGDRLGRPPDEVELLDVVAFDAGKPIGLLDHHVFRFRVLPPHRLADRGWMLGVAGPFRRKSTPTLDDHGGTDSELDRARGKNPAKKVDAKKLKKAWEAEHGPEAWEE